MKRFSFYLFSFVILAVMIIGGRIFLTANEPPQFYNPDSVSWVQGTAVHVSSSPSPIPEDRLDHLPVKERYLFKMLQIRLERGEMEEVKKLLPEIKNAEKKIDTLFSFYEKQKSPLTVNRPVQQAVDFGYAPAESRAVFPQSGIPLSELLDLITEEILSLEKTETMSMKSFMTSTETTFLPGISTSQTEHEQSAEESCE